MTGTTRVIVGLNGSLGSLAALYRAVPEAAARSAVLVPVTAWQPSDGDDLRPLSELAYAARERVDTAFEQAFGGYPTNPVVHPMVVRGDAGPALVSAVGSQGDLIVVGSAGHGRLRRALHGSTAHYCRTHAACRVVTVSPSELLRSLELAALSGTPLPLAAGAHAR
ncbi:universal stress protein [Kitasatospora cathayae]|uniref:Universal stress protein n=1 Tax=Kitasatospora cathayae TaxID=3004092 RepID=A0ABY7PXL0_9ACTN|nr:universal stress protein [Kitasatospora sp. HUAS 3-15]WBP85187.1 universal stress protein [Kitasatospora sp. HUAS 3-15]